MKSVLRVLPVVVALALGMDAYAINAKDYDLDGNGWISQDENEAYARAMTSPLLEAFDANSDGELLPAEVAAAEQALASTRSELDDLLYTFKTEYPRGQALADYARDRQSQDWKALQRDKPGLRFPILLREKHEDISHTRTRKPPAKAKPAQIAFSRDIEADNEVLTFNGALMWPLRLRPDIGLLGVPSVTINKVTNDRLPEKGTDSMVFRFGLDLERQGAKPESLNYWRLNPTWTTDTDTDLSVRGLEAQWEPTGYLPGQSNAYFVNGGPIGIRWRSILHVEYGNVADNAGNESLIEGEDFLRAGLKLESLFVPRSTDRISLGLSWHYLANVSGDFRDRKLFAAALSASLDAEKHFSLQAKYTNGDTSAALENQQLWTIGLGIIF